MLAATLRTCYIACLGSNCVSSIINKSMARQHYTSENYTAQGSIGYLIRRARTLITGQVEALFAERFKDKEVTFVQWVILMCLRENLARNPSEISQYMCYDSGALTRVIDQMEERKLLTRTRSTEDRRVVELSLTPEGNKLTDSLIIIVAERYNEILADFSKAEADQLIFLLHKLVDGLTNIPVKGN